MNRAATRHRRLSRTAALSSFLVLATSATASAGSSNGRLAAPVLPERTSGQLATVSGKPAGTRDTVAPLDCLRTMEGFSDACPAWVVDAPTKQQDYARGLVVSPDGSQIFITGTDNPIDWDGSQLQSASHNDYGDIMTVSYDAVDGVELWRARYAGPKGCCGYDEHVASKIALSPDGSTVFVSGRSIYYVLPEGESFGKLVKVLITIAYDAATGRQLWESSYSGRFHTGEPSDQCCLTVSSDGNQVFVSASMTLFTPLRTMWVTLAHDTASGELLWDARHDGALRSDGRNYTEPTDAAVGRGAGLPSADGSRGDAIIVIGATSLPDDHPSARSYGVSTIAYDARTGTVLRSLSDENLAGDYEWSFARSISVAGGRAYVGGATIRRTDCGMPNCPLIADSRLVAYDLDEGTMDWVASGEGQGAIRDISIDAAAGRIYTASDSVIGGAGVHLLVVTIMVSAETVAAVNTSDGAALWSQTYNHAGAVSLIARSDRGDVVVAEGASVHEGSNDYGVSIFDGSTGTRTWVARYNHSAAGVDVDGPAYGGTALSADGKRLYMTGFFMDAQGMSLDDYTGLGWDMGTLAWRLP